MVPAPGSTLLSDFIIILLLLSVTGEVVAPGPGSTVNLISVEFVIPAHDALLLSLIDPCVAFI